LKLIAKNAKKTGSNLHFVSIFEINLNLFITIQAYQYHIFGRLLLYQNMALVISMHKKFTKNARVRRSDFDQV